MKNLDCLFIIILMISSISLGYLIGKDHISVPNFDKKMNTENCNNLDLKESSECLRNYVQTFYNYTIRDDTEKTLEDIKLNGGDCYDYSLIYEKLAKGLGFYSETKSIFTKDGGHKFAIVWDKNLTSYCILDQLSVMCTSLGEVEEN